MTTAAPAGWLLFSEMPLVGALPTAAGVARAHVRAVLLSWQVSGDTADILELIVDEFVANAVNASTGHDGRPRYGPGGLLPVVGVGLFGDGSRLLAEVWDQAPGKPTPREVTDAAESGRGLLLVRELSARWGWHPHDGWKCVWAEITA